VCGMDSRTRYDFVSDVVLIWNSKVIHIWQYEGGYAGLDIAAKKTASYKAYNEYRKERAKMLKQRTNQLLVQFNYMPDPLPRSGSNIYELRSYRLKSGMRILVKLKLKLNVQLIKKCIMN